MKIYQNVTTPAGPGIFQGYLQSGDSILALVSHNRTLLVSQIKEKYKTYHAGGQFGFVEFPIEEVQEI